MAWKIELSAHAERDLHKIDIQTRKRISSFLSSRLANLDDPRALGQALRGERFGNLWRYRVGDYRIVCEIQDEKVLILVVKIGHRREGYRF